MTKIEKKDIDNINTVIKEAKIKDVSSIRIKKGDYEIEISSKEVAKVNEKSLVVETITENKDLKNNNNEINEENIVKSPMVGVAYLSADPNSPAYVKVGQHVKAGDTLLLIEAMKTFNEIKAPRSGIIKKIVALNSQPVEYGDTLLIFE
tara:strand:- start:158 stop:604 length:447 start_codon:yes stop_codon:yes gene_type:complete